MTGGEPALHSESRLAEHRSVSGRATARSRTSGPSRNRSIDLNVESLFDFGLQRLLDGMAALLER
ncbi:hypothetical protein [Micromonospora arida]|uniref:hypothetical protein n=1 Tax=Micromonospora arida TaxID=2203715 RepID=UPI0033A5AF04